VAEREEDLAIGEGEVKGTVGFEQRAGEALAVGVGG